MIYLTLVRSITSKLCAIKAMRFARKRRDLYKIKKMHNDNARAHISLLICKYLSNNNTVVIAPAFILFLSVLESPMRKKL